MIQIKLLQGFRNSLSACLSLPRDHNQVAILKMGINAMLMIMGMGNCNKGCIGRRKRFRRVPSEITLSILDICKCVRMGTIEPIC